MSQGLHPTGIHRWSAEHLGQQYRPHRPDYVPTGSRYAGPLMYGPRPVWRRIVRLVVSLLAATTVATALAGLVLLVIWETVAHA